MPKKKHQNEMKRPYPIPIVHDRDVPTHDFFEHLDLSKSWDIEEALNNFIFELESDYFLTWEAVICEEEGFPLTKKQKTALGNLVNFGDEREDERILYINEIPRPKEPWYEIAKKIVSHLVEKEPFDTTGGGSQLIFEGWPELLEALKKYAVHLSLPEKVKSPLEIFPPAIIHQLNLQLCLDSLSGLGQDDDLTLENKKQQDRIDDLIMCLKEHKDTARYFNLTLETLLSKVNMPEKDEKIFKKLMKKHLILPSEKAHFIDYLL